MGQIFDSVKAFIKEPFTTPMSFWQFSALVGLAIIIAALWGLVLHEIEKGVREI